MLGLIEDLETCEQKNRENESHRNDYKCTTVYLQAKYLQLILIFQPRMMFNFC